MSEAHVSINEKAKNLQIIKDFLQSHKTEQHDIDPVKLAESYGPVRRLTARYTKEPLYASLMPIPLDDPVCADLPNDTILRANQLIIRARNKFHSKLVGANFPALSLNNEQIVELSKTSNPYERIAIRCNGNVPCFETDFDGSWTTGYNRAMRRCLPNADTFELALQRADDPRFFVVMFVQHMQNELIEHPQKFTQAGNYVQLRASAVPALSYFKNHNVPVEMISRQFKPIITRALEKKIRGRLNDFITSDDIIAITPTDISATFKGYYAAMRAIESGTPVAACGDSLIDLSLLTPFGHDAVSVMFVLKNSKLAYILRTYPPRFTDWVTVLEYKSFKTIQDHYEGIIDACTRYKKKKYQ